MAHHAPSGFGLHSNSFTPPARLDEDFVSVYLAQSNYGASPENAFRGVPDSLENLDFDDFDAAHPAQPDTLWAHQWSDLYPISAPYRYCAPAQDTAPTVVAAHVLPPAPDERVKLLDEAYADLLKSIIREDQSFQLQQEDSDDDSRATPMTAPDAFERAQSLSSTYPEAGQQQAQAIPGTKQYPIFIDDFQSSPNKKRVAGEDDTNPRPFKAVRKRTPSSSSDVVSSSNITVRSNPKPTETKVPRPVAVGTSGAPPPSRTNGTAGLAQSNFSNRINNQENYGLGLKGRVPPDCQLPLNIDIGLRETLTFFPNHVQIPEFADRLMRNGIPIKQAAKMQLFAVDRINKKDVLTVENRLKQQLSKAGKILYKDEIGDKPWEQSVAVKKGAQTDLTANSWKLRSQHAGHSTNFHNFKLADIAKAVPRERWPKGNDALLITKCLEYAMDHPDEDWNTTHWHVLITMLRLQPPAVPANYTTRDHEALKRFMEEVANPTN